MPDTPRPRDFTPTRSVLESWLSTRLRREHVDPNWLEASVEDLQREIDQRFRAMATLSVEAHMSGITSNLEHERARADGQLIKAEMVRQLRQTRGRSARRALETATRDPEFSTLLQDPDLDDRIRQLEQKRDALNERLADPEGERRRVFARREGRIKAGPDALSPDLSAIRDRRSELVLHATFDNKGQGIVPTAVVEAIESMGVHSRAQLAGHGKGDDAKLDPLIVAIAIETIDRQLHSLALAQSVELPRSLRAPIRPKLPHPKKPGDSGTLR